LTTLIGLYQSVKLVAYVQKGQTFGVIDVPSILTLGKGPITRPSALQTKWAFKGMWDGSPLTPGYAP